MAAASAGAPIGGVLAVQAARSRVGRDGDPGDGIGYVVPAFLGAGTAVLLVLAAAAVVLAFRGDGPTCRRVARWVVLLPVLASLPLLLIPLAARTATALLAALPLAVTAIAAGAVWRSPRLGIATLASFLIAGTATTAALGLDAVYLLLPHLLAGLGCWAIGLGLLGAAAVRSAPPSDRPPPPHSDRDR